jgi:hypothetical protein
MVAWSKRAQHGEQKIFREIMISGTAPTEPTRQLGLSAFSTIPHQRTSPSEERRNTTHGWTF